MRWLSGWRERLRSSWWGLILVEHDTEPTELTGGGAKVLIGAWLLLPAQTFSISPAFRDLAVLPEWTWGAFLVTVGMLHLAAIQHGHVSWRRYSSLVGFLVWFVMGVTFLVANFAGLGSLAFLILASGQLWCSIRLQEPS